ncbi:helix-turn-helix domain-containing protein [Streptomyces sediminimaris]|uniref:helix-turn-helix domain-containing protein n=1 Tax=Streptomyces sediminimaris TaxID=3383721 RepID=UPI00399BDC52
MALPPAEERRTLREELSLSRAQLARALGVSPSTVGGWESGRDPSGEVREKCGYFLQGAKAKLAAEAAEAAEVAETTGEVPEDEPEGEVRADAGQAAGQDDDADVLAAPRPCVLCGHPARHQVKGSPSTWTPPSAKPRSPRRRVGLRCRRHLARGLMVVRAMGTDELHVIGDWRAAFEEGRCVTEVKLKDTYTVGGSDTQDGLAD